MSSPHLLSRDEVREMFDAVAPRYDLLNRILSLGVDRRWREEAVLTLRLQPGDSLVDICGGTGDLALEAERQVPGIRTVNLDLSLPMLRRYRKRAGGRVSAAVGDAMRLPLRRGIARAAIIGFGIRNVPDRLQALTEIHDMLVAGGRLVVLEFALPGATVVRGPYLFYLRHILPRVAAILSPSPDAYRYLGDSIEAFPSPGAFADLLRQSGFGEVSWRPLSLGIAVRYLAVKAGERPRS